MPIQIDGIRTKRMHYNSVMNFVVAVYGSPYATGAQQHALKFCQACVAAGHSITRVFFYHEGVYVALGTRVSPQDEADATSAWQEFASSADVELCVCIANGLKRGVVTQAEAERAELTLGGTLADRFELVGLGQLIDAVLSSDRLVEFPA